MYCAVRVPMLSVLFQLTVSILACSCVQWFHVDSLSSAHVYFRLCTEKGPAEGIPIDDLPADSVYDMMQIVKHNSISGCKLASTKIVYTPWSNLKKTFEMDSGTVTYHNTKLCRYSRCDKDRQRVKELEITKTERANVDFYQEMKANERRIVERKKRDRNNRKGDDLGLYDPIQDELHSGRMKATRVGDDQSGIDKGLAEFEGLSFAKTQSFAPRTGGTGGVAAEEDSATNVIRPDDPIWVNEANDRSIEPSANVRFLRARGYTSLDAAGALDDQTSSNNARIAALKLLWQNGVVNSTPSASDSESPSLEEASETRKEEKEVLQAIFGEDDGVCFSDDEALFDSIFPITSYEAPPRYELPPPLLLEIYVDKGVAPLYPNEPPVLALVGGGLPEALLKELTNRLRTEAVQRCQEEPGDPQIFNLLAFIAEEVEKIIDEEATELVVQRKQRYAEMKKAEAERKSQEQLDQPTTSESAQVPFKSEEQRRAYAMRMVTQVKGSMTIDTADVDLKKKEKSKTRYAGISDQSLIDDLFK